MCEKGLSYVGCAVLSMCGIYLGKLFYGPALSIMFSAFLCDGVYVQLTPHLIGTLLFDDFDGQLITIVPVLSPVLSHRDHDRSLCPSLRLSPILSLAIYPSLVLVLALALASLVP